MPRKQFRFNAVSMTTPSGRELYAFPIDGKKIPEIASVSPASRDVDGRLSGFQRGTVPKHIADIARYIDATDDPFIANAIVIAFTNKDVRFEPFEGKPAATEGRAGILHVPAADEDGMAAGQIVDGQQRTMAVGKAKVDRFPLFVCAFVETDTDVLREQFVTVNATKPLPSSLINELLPGLRHVPGKHISKVAAAALAERLAHDSDSPLRKFVKTHTGKQHSKDAPIEINSLIAPLQALSKDSKSIFGSHVDESGAVNDIAAILRPLKSFWTAVREVFPDAFAKKAKSSRLTHGVGIWALMHLMDRMLDVIGVDAEVDRIVEELQLIEEHCAWTEGQWDSLDGFSAACDWNWLQNLPDHKKLLTGFLVRKYREARNEVANAR